jgi:preprotein translocase subunit SecD
MKSRAKKSTRVRSSIILIFCLALIGFLAYSGVYGFNFAGYRLKSFSEVITKGLDLQGGVSILEEIQSKNVSQETVDRTVDLLSLRVNKLGVSETVVRKKEKIE